MDQEVAKTLGELELKLQELERELTSIGRRDTPPKTEQASSEPQTSSKLIDEAVERDGEGPDSYQNDEQERAVDNAFGGPAVFGGEEVPAQGTTISSESAFPVSETAYGEIATGSIATGSPQSTPSFPSGVFAPPPPHASEPGPPLPPPAERSLPPQGPPLQQPGPSLPSPAQAPQPSASLRGAPPAPIPPPPPPVDRVELVRFKEKMQRTMEDLIDEYGKLLLPKPPA